MAAIYHYDGTFEGFLTALHVIKERKDCPADITGTSPRQGGLFSGMTKVETDGVKSTTFLENIVGKISPLALRNAYHAFLSERSGVEMAIYRYLELGWLEGRNLDGHLADKRVISVHKAACKAKGEAYRMKGFVRFREVREGFFYAPLEPDCRILPLVATHFAARFGDQNWVIHDIGRGEGIIHDASRRHWLIARLELAHDPQYSEREKIFTGLWQRYFSGVAIAERLNPILQRSRLPLKYRKYLVELEASCGEESSPAGMIIPL